MKHNLQVDYRKKRRMDYPSIGDQLDAIWKALDGRDLPPETADMLKAIKSVKAKFKK